MQLHAKLRPAVIVVAVLVVSSVFMPSLSIAVPTNSRIEEKQAEARVAQAALEDLAAELELRTEEYYAIEARLAETRDAIRDTREELARADADLVAATERLQDRASGMYRSGGVDMIEVMLGTTSFKDFVSRMDWLSRIGRSDARLVSDVKEARARVEETQRVLERREEEQSALRASAKQKKAEIEAAVDRQTSYVEGLNAEVAALVREEEERQKRLAEERAAQAAREAAARAAAANRTGSPASGAPTPVEPGALGQGHPEALAVGLKYVGVPYLWAGSTPVGFDCSGLTQYVYREIGINIPRSSREQFRAGAHIPPDRLDLVVPGDLVFFGYGGDPNRVHHVGIYAGNGTYLHAPYTGASVRVDSLTARIQSRGDYVGAARY